MDRPTGARVLDERLVDEREVVLGGLAGEMTADSEEDTRCPVCSGYPILRGREPGVRVDDRVEPFVRMALHWAVQRDLQRFDEALDAYPDVDSALEGHLLARLICLAVVVDVHDGVPAWAGEHVRDLAESVAEAESWAGCSAETVETFLTALLARTPLEQVLPAEDVLILPYVVGASMLSRPRTDGSSWVTYLTRIEAYVQFLLNLPARSPLARRRRFGLRW